MPKTGAYRDLDFSLSATERIKSMLLDLTTDPDYDGFDTRALAGVRLIRADASTGSSEFEFTVTPNLCNKGGNLHGGASTTLLDNLTSTALYLLAKPGFLDGGSVSRTLTTTCLRPVPVGTTVRVVCEVVSVGKRTAHLQGTIKTLDGKVCVVCAHDKAVLSKPTL